MRASELFLMPCPRLTWAGVHPAHAPRASRAAVGRVQMIKQTCRSERVLRCPSTQMGSVGTAPEDPCPLPTHSIGVGRGPGSGQRNQERKIE